jgi:hypothetical protein
VHSVTHCHIPHLRLLLIFPVRLRSFLSPAPQHASLVSLRRLSQRSVGIVPHCSSPFCVLSAVCSICPCLSLVDRLLPVASLSDLSVSAIPVLRSAGAPLQHRRVISRTSPTLQRRAQHHLRSHIFSTPITRDIVAPCHRTSTIHDDVAAVRRRPLRKPPLRSRACCDRA